MGPDIPEGWEDAHGSFSGGGERFSDAFTKAAGKARKAAEKKHLLRSAAVLQRDLRTRKIFKKIKPLRRTK